MAVPGGAGAGPAADTGSGPEELTADISELPEDREGGCRGPSRRLWGAGLRGTRTERHRKVRGHLCHASVLSPLGLTSN